MDQNELIKGIEGICERIAGPLGYEIVDIEYRRERNRYILRLYLDHPRGISLDNCAELSHLIGDALEIEELILHSYTLEVSSPGLNRPLRKRAHFEKALNQKIRVKTTEPIAGRKNFCGKLLRVDEMKVEIEDSQKMFEIPFAGIQKANVEFNFDDYYQKVKPGKQKTQPHRK
jgi:ribosome maturation factor RimP